MKDKALRGLRKKATYNSLVGYLDGGQETIKYPNRLAMQLKNSHQMSNLLDDEGKGWFQENKAQMRNFTTQQVRETVIKENLQQGQTFQQEKMADMLTPKPRQPKQTQRHEIGLSHTPTPQPNMGDLSTPKPSPPRRTPRHEIGLSHTPTPQPQVYDMVSKDLDEKMEQQRHDIEDQYAFETEKEQEKKKVIAERFKKDLGDELTPYQKAFNKKKSKYDKSSSSTDKPNPDNDPESTHEPKGKRGRPPKPKEPVIPSVEATHEPKGKPGRPRKVEKKSSDKRKKDRSPPVVVKRGRPSKADILLRLQQAEEVAKEKPKPASPKPQPEPEPPKPEPPKPTPSSSSSSKAVPPPAPAPVIKPRIFQKERPLLPPDKVNLTGITESFKEAYIKLKISPGVYQKYTRLFTEYKKSAGNPDRKAVILNDLRVLYGEHVYKK